MDEKDIGELISFKMPSLKIIELGNQQIKIEYMGLGSQVAKVLSQANLPHLLKLILRKLLLTKLVAK